MSNRKAPLERPYSIDHFAPKYRTMKHTINQKLNYMNVLMKINGRLCRKKELRLDSINEDNGIYICAL